MGFCLWQCPLLTSSLRFFYQGMDKNGHNMYTCTELLRFQNTLTTIFQKTSMSWEIDYYTYKKLPDKNSGFKNLEKSGRVPTLK